MSMHIAKVIALTYLLAPAPAQEPDLEQAERELAAMFVRPAGQRVDGSAVVAKLDAFLDTYPPEKLGHLGYATALQAYFARDYELASEELGKFLRSHRTIRHAEHRNMAGRICLSGMIRALRADPLDVDAVLRQAEWALNLYDDKRMILRQLAANIARGSIAEPERLRVPITRVLVRANLPEPEIDALLREIYATDVEMTAAGAARPPTAAPTTLKPFREQALSGKTIDLKDYAGKVVLVDFWATWCGPCIQEMPNVVRIYQQYKDQGFEIIGVSLDRADAEATIAAAEKQHGMTWEQIYTSGKALAENNGVRSIPFTFLLDREGVVRHTGLRGAALERAVSQLVAKK